MPTLLVFGVSDVTDAQAMDTYATAGAASLSGHSFKFLAGPEPGEQLEGEPHFDKFVILRFQTRDAAQAWYRSDAYQAAIGLRRSVAKTFAMLIDTNE